MEQSANVGEDGVVSSSSAAATGGRAVSVSRWTSTAWSADQPVTSHGHQVIAECPVWRRRVSHSSFNSAFFTELIRELDI